MLNKEKIFLFLVLLLTGTTLSSKCDGYCVNRCNDFFDEKLKKKCLDKCVNCSTAAKCISKCRQIIVGPTIRTCIDRCNEAFEQEWEVPCKKVKGFTASCKTLKCRTCTKSCNTRCSGFIDSSVGEKCSKRCTIRCSDEYLETCNTDCNKLFRPTQYRTKCHRRCNVALVEWPLFEPCKISGDGGEISDYKKCKKIRKKCKKKCKKSKNYKKCKKQKCKKCKCKKCKKSKAKHYRRKRRKVSRKCKKCKSKCSKKCKRNRSCKRKCSKKCKRSCKKKRKRKKKRNKKSSKCRKCKSKMKKCKRKCKRSRSCKRKCSKKCKRSCKRKRLILDKKCKKQCVLKCKTPDNKHLKRGKKERKCRKQCKKKCKLSEQPEVVIEPLPELAIEPPTEQSFNMEWLKKSKTILNKANVDHKKHILFKSHKTSGNYFLKHYPNFKTLTEDFKRIIEKLHTLSQNKPKQVRSILSIVNRNSGIDKSNIHNTVDAAKLREMIKFMRHLAYISADDELAIWLNSFRQ